MPRTKSYDNNDQPTADIAVLPAVDRGNADTVALGFFWLTIFLSVMAVKFGPGGLPWRSFTLVLTGALLVYADPSGFRSVIRRCLPMIAFIAAIAVLGIVTSVIGHNSPQEYGRQLLEIHAQAAIGVLVVYALAERVGPRLVLAPIVTVTIVTGCVAVLQSLGVDMAWHLREGIGRATNDPKVLLSAFARHDRALGLSFSPISLSYQLCLALGAYYYMRLARGRSANRHLDVRTIAFAGLMIVFAVASGNRSATLGIIAFVFVYIGSRDYRLLGIVLPMALLVGLVALPTIQSLDSESLRVVSTEDGSAAGRTTLRQFGLFLIAQRPFGYGLAVQSIDYWQDFFSQARYLPNPQSIQNYPLHNYYLNVLLKYGITALFFVPWILPRRKAHLLLWIGFVPYMIHIFYHNEGPLSGDFLVFYIIAVGVWMAHHAEALVGSQQPTRRSWRRAFPVEVR